MAISEQAMITQWRVVVAAPASIGVDSLVDYLQEQQCSVTFCRDSKDLVRQIAFLLPRLVVVSAPTLLDVLDNCRAVRLATTAPLLVLGQQDLETEEVLSLEYGADTYLPPSASDRKLRAHLAALLRRVKLDLELEPEEPMQFGSVRIDPGRRRVYRGDIEVELSQEEFALLLFLVEHAGRTVSRQDLAAYVWGVAGSGESRSLDVHIHWLREKLEVDAANPRHIRTVRGIGYSFEP